VTYLPTVEELERELLRERQSIESRRAGEGAVRAEKMERGG
jgi:hypothetical protein